MTGLSQISDKSSALFSFKGPKIQLCFDELMWCKVLRGESSINDASRGQPLSKPSFFIVVDGRDVKDFRVYECNLKDLKTCFGAGKQLRLKGVAKGPKNCRIEKTLFIEIYDRYPNAAITYATYKNLGPSDLTLEKSYSNYYRLDASLLSKNSNPYDFWSLQGSSLEWGRDYVFKIDDGFAQENWMGFQPKTRLGGGLPLVDLWTNEMGMAVAHIEPVPKLVYLPVEAQADKKVAVSVRNDVNVVLPPKESYTTIKTVVITHSLDYFDALSTYSKMMRDQSLEMKEPSEEAYEPIWCGWGYGTDFTMSDILNTLPKLKDFGIHWVVIDYRWFDHHGDWKPRRDTFPGGEQQFKEFVETLHKEGFMVKIWWGLPNADPPFELPEAERGWTYSGTSEITKKHPEWLIMDKDHKYPLDNWGKVFLCPSLLEVQDYFRNLTKKFIGEWGVDGHKLDAFYTVPRCYNPKHGHSRPEESVEDLPKILKVIYETTKSIKPCSVIEVCNCGTAQDFFQEPYIDQPVTSDPVSSWQVRKRIKVYKALMGPRCPAYGDHVELTNIEFTPKGLVEKGWDFVSTVGTGGVIGTKFTWPNGPENVRLIPEKEAHWVKWIKIYRKYMLSKGEYLNLYDIAYDKPEAHVVRKGEDLYYAFYADSWDGPLDLRGLEKMKYELYDYENESPLGMVTGPKDYISLRFSDHILIKAFPLQ